MFGRFRNLLGLKKRVAPQSVEAHGEPFPIQDLPHELIPYLLNFMTVEDAMAASQSSRFFYDMIDNAWWKEKYQLYFPYFFLYYRKQKQEN